MEEQEHAVKVPNLPQCEAQAMNFAIPILMLIVIPLRECSDEATDESTENELDVAVQIVPIGGRTVRFIKFSSLKN